MPLSALALSSRRLIVLVAALLALLLLFTHHQSSLVLPQSIADLKNAALTSLPHWTTASTTTPTTFPSEEQANGLVQAISTFSVVPPGTKDSDFAVAICAVPTHEGQFLPEWLTWHRLLGVQRFYLFDNAPSAEMRALLRPWLEEGSVVLYEMDYSAQGELVLGEVYQQHVLRLCERHVLTKSKWVSHHDVDEFLMVNPPGWTSHVPTPSSTAMGGWTYPLHTLLERLDRATCVPIARSLWVNVGAREMSWDERVTERHITRERNAPNRATYGKIFLHAPEEPALTSWFGPHSCKPACEEPFTSTVVLDVHGNLLEPRHNIYPSEGLPLPQEGIILHHYAQRSLSDCYHKVSVLANAPSDWRSVDGLPGCARNYCPSDAELVDGGVERLLAEAHGEQLADRPDGWLSAFVGDTTARESWQGRMTRVILDGWQGEKGWKWLEQGVLQQDGKAQGVVRLVITPELELDD